MRRKKTMSKDEIRQNTDALFKALSDPANEKLAIDAISEFTRDKMYRLRHIPARYYLLEPITTLKIMYKELNKKGYIDLDRDGKPCCLTNLKPVLSD